MEKDAGGTNIQDRYLGRARKDRSWLTVVLNSGKKISGRIVSFDRYTVILEDRGGEQMVFKHAIATVSLARSFSNAIDFDKTRPPNERPPAVAEPRPIGHEARDRDRRREETPEGTDRSRSGPRTAD